MNRPQVLMVLALMFGCVAFVSANSQEAFLRRVRGTVYSAQELPLPSAIVYLRNLRTNKVGTYLSNRKGQYRFSGLKPYEDYEVHAEYRGLTSEKKIISKSDDKREIVINLKVDKREYVELNIHSLITEQPGERIQTSPRVHSQ